MGFMKPKAKPVQTAKPVKPVVEIPTAEPAIAQKTVDEAEADKITKKKQQIRAGKSALTVGLKTSTGSVNTGGTSTGGSGLAVGGV